MTGVAGRMPARRSAGLSPALVIGALTAVLCTGAAYGADRQHEAPPASARAPEAGPANAAPHLPNISSSQIGDAVRRAARTARAGEAVPSRRAVSADAIEVAPHADPRPGADDGTAAALAEHGAGRAVVVEGAEPRLAGAAAVGGQTSGSGAAGHAAAAQAPETNPTPVETASITAPATGDHSTGDTPVAPPQAEAAHAKAGGHGPAEPEAKPEEEAPGTMVAGESETPHDPDAPWPKRRGPMPYEIVRSLQFLQDQVARGNGPAIRVQSILLQRFGPTLSDADPKVWEDSRNLRAAALFVLSGGSPMVLRSVLSKVDLTGANRALFEGALAFVENRTAKAEEVLSSLDLTYVETGLAAQINLALAQLQQQAKPKEALERLQQVTLAAPGTLLEEAALRMGVLIAESSGDRALSDRFARQYFDRFSGSAYAGNFRARFAAVYALRPAGTEDDTMATIADATATIPAGEQLGIYLAVARRSLVEGNLVLAARASEKALTFAGAARADRQRALLYQIASTLTARDFAQAKTMLDAIDRKELHPADAKLRDAAYDVLAQMRQPLLADASMPSLAKSGTPATGEPAPAAVLARGTALLDAIDNDLMRASQ